MKLLPDEDYWSYLDRVYHGRQEHGVTCTDIAEATNLQFGLNNGESVYRKAIRLVDIGRELERKKMELQAEDAYLTELEDKRRALAAEKIKLQTEKTELTRMMRRMARDELFFEKIVAAIEQTPKPEEHKLIPVKQENTEWILAFGDCHYGTEFTLRGLKGEIINQYSPEIFEDRMWKLLSEVAMVAAKENINTLNVFNLGDELDGILRVKQLATLRYGVVESTVRFANFMVDWLDELSKVVRVKYHSVAGNHTELRMLGQPKGTFAEENMADIISEIIRGRLSGNKNFEIITNPTGLIFSEVAGFTVLGIHGEGGELSKLIGEISNTYKTTVDMLIGGHYHHRLAEDIGRRRSVISVKSIIGIDDYALSLHRTSDAGAALIGVETGKGDVVHRNIVLN